MASLVVAAAVSAAATSGQGAPVAPSGPLSLEQAVQFALLNAPAARAARAGEEAAHSGIDLARTDYLPRFDALWQTNRATRNNTAGLLLPQSVVPPVSGPVAAEPDSRPVWGSAGGLLLSWEPFDFGRRRASVLAATAAESRASAEEALARLDIATIAADAFLTLVAAQETRRAAGADVERREVVTRSIRALAGSQLRPGADVSRAEAELAGARIAAIRAGEQEQRARSALGVALGIAGSAPGILAGPFLSTLPSEAVPADAAASPGAGIHPRAAADKAAVDEAASRTRAESHSYAPRLHLDASYSGRGSGVDPEGNVSDGSNGLSLDRDNWAVGLTLSFRVMDLPAHRARERIEAARQEAAEARYDQSLQDLIGLAERARIAWESARLVAESTPAQLDAARTNETQARARYDAGLGTITDVADAQRLLVQAETEDAIARVGAWRALLELGNAEGDLRPFFGILSSQVPGER